MDELCEKCVAENSIYYSNIYGAEIRTSKLQPLQGSGFRFFVTKFQKLYST